MKDDKNYVREEKETLRAGIKKLTTIFFSARLHSEVQDIFKS